MPLAPRAYDADVAPILRVCGGEVCHGTFGSPRGLLATAIDAPAEECCGTRVIVAPGHPERSYMLNKVRGEDLCAGKRMPPPGPLSAQQIQVLSDWICEGAPTQ